MKPRQIAASASADRIRGRKLQRIRARVLSAEPRCVLCLARGIVNPATEVDHVVALTNGGTDDEFDDSNRAGICSACHRAKTIEDMRIARGEAP